MCAFVLISIVFNVLLIFQNHAIKADLEKLEDTSTPQIYTLGSAFFYNDPFYKKYDVGLGKTYYQISSSKKIFAEGIKEGSDPRITNMGGKSGGIVKLELGCGSNCNNVQYFDIFEDNTSEVFFVAGLFADYVDPYGNQLIARFDYRDTEPPKNILIIQDIFDNTAFYGEIARNYADFVDPGVRMLFLNENQLYIEYVVTNQDDEKGTYRTKTEIIDFR
jgi:hypothetical protein